MSKSTDGRKKTSPQTKEERLAEALRANLRRRKAGMSSRSATPSKPVKP